jgi:hypothetical protein
MVPGEVQVDVVIFAYVQRLVKTAFSREHTSPVQHGPMHPDDITSQQRAVGVRFDLRQGGLVKESTIFINTDICPENERCVRMRTDAPDVASHGTREKPVVRIQKSNPLAVTLLESCIARCRETSIRLAKVPHRCVLTGDRRSRIR